MEFFVMETNNYAKGCKTKYPKKPRYKPMLTYVNDMKAFNAICDGNTDYSVPSFGRAICHD